MSVPAAAFYTSKIKMAVLGIGSAALCLVGLVISLGLLPNAHMDTFTRAFGATGVLFFGFLAVFWSRQLFDSGVVLQVSGEGIQDKRYSSAIVPWSVVEKIRLTQNTYQEFLSLEFPGDVQAKFPRSWYRRFFDFLNPMLGYKGMLITMTGLNGSTEDLIAAINAVAPQRLKNFL